MLAVLLAVAGAGCSETLPLHGDVTFTAEERAEIEEADVWLASKVGGAPLGIVWDMPHGEGDDRSVRRGASPGARGGLGHYQSADRSITIDADRVAVEGDMRVVAAHELAHLRGIDHHGHDGLMSQGPGALVWTTADEDVCRASGVCR